MSLSYFDPGSRHNALAIVEPLPPGSAHYLRLVCAPETLPAGAQVPLTKPRTTATGAILTHRHQVLPAHAAALALLVLARCKAHGVTAITIELAERFNASGNVLADSGMGTELSNAKMIVGAVASTLLAAGIEVYTVAVQTWRAQVSRWAKPLGLPTSYNGRGTALAPILAATIEGWPAACDEHERDAGGMALAALLPALPVKVPGERRTRKPRGPQAPRAYKPKPPKPCGCPGSHRKTCEHYARRDWRAEKAALRAAYLATAPKDPPVVSRPRPVSRRESIDVADVFGVEIDPAFT